MVPTDIQSEIKQLIEKYKVLIKESDSPEKIKFLEKEVTSKKGIFFKYFKLITSLKNEQKRDIGQLINNSKKKLLLKITEKRSKLLLPDEKNNIVDPTLPSETQKLGTIHIVNQTISIVREIFSKIGFVQISYPEIEYEHFAFDALRMPPDHPARDDFEAIFLELPTDKKLGKRVLSPHTSSGQPREMLRVKKPPIRMINIAKCYRPNWDITHTPMFYQFEGLCVDTNIHIGHLKWTLDYFAESFFGKGVKTRLRPFHFQFTEPSFEVDITCIVCGGKQSSNTDKPCSLCKSGWLELGGTGMVHPYVLKTSNIDPNKYSGWAFGFGIERITMMKHAITDIRLLYENDIRFLKQW